MSSNPILSEEWPDSWVRDRTYVRFFDDDGKEIAVIDGVTGLAWTLENGQEGDAWILDESVFPNAKWVFDATYLTGDGVEVPRGWRTIREENLTESDGTGWAALYAELMAGTESPWQYPGASVQFALYAERDVRLQTCRACPFYRHREGTCEIDDAFIPVKTCDAAAVCPDSPPRWEESPSYSPALAANYAATAVVHAPSDLTPEQIAAQAAEQAAFEAEWEARNVG